MICSIKNHKQAIDALCNINAGADVQDYDGRTAVHLASAAGKKDIVETLISTFDAGNFGIFESFSSLRCEHPR